MLKTKRTTEVAEVLQDKIISDRPQMKIKIHLIYLQINKIKEDSNNKIRMIQHLQGIIWVKFKKMKEENYSKPTNIMRICYWKCELNRLKDSLASNNSARNQIARIQIPIQHLKVLVWKAEAHHRISTLRISNKMMHPNITRVSQAIAKGS